MRTVQRLFMGIAGFLATGFILCAFGCGSGKIVRLVDATVNGEQGAVEGLLQSGVDPNGLHPEEDTTALIEAAAKGNAGIVLALIGAGADVNLRNSEGRTPLWSAARLGHVEVVELLTENGADPNAYFGDFDPPLHAAILEDDMDTIRALLAAGADVNLVDSLGESALGEAVFWEHSETALVLLELGADMSQPANEAAFVGAAEKGQTDLLVACLESGAEIDSTVHGRTALMEATRTGHKESTRLLIERGADVNKKDGRGYTALHYAVDKWSPELVQTLLAAGADVNAADDLAVTALMQAAHWGPSWGPTSEVMDKLLAARPAVDLRDKDGDTALHYAAGPGHHENAERLIRAGADVNLQGEGARTPLISAVIADSAGTVRALLDARARLDLRDDQGRSALQVAIEYERQEIVSILEEANAPK